VAVFTRQHTGQQLHLGEWPELKGFYLANGFSGHGLQQGPAVGRLHSELILGVKPALDLTIFSHEESGKQTAQ